MFRAGGGRDPLTLLNPGFSRAKNPQAPVPLRESASICHHSSDYLPLTMPYRSDKN
jgi:hypothetical protein